MYVSFSYKCSSSNILKSHLLGKSTKVHLYYYMKNCAQSAAYLRDSNLNIVKHYQASCGSTTHMCTCSRAHTVQHSQVSCKHALYTHLFVHTHLQNQHANCHQDSSCHRPGYSPTKIQLTSPAEIEAYKKALKATLIYRNAESYCRGICAGVVINPIMNQIVSRHVLGGII